MPKIYKLVNPKTNIAYYVGYTEKPLQQRLIGHLYFFTPILGMIMVNYTCLFGVKQKKLVRE